MILLRGRRLQSTTVLLLLRRTCGLWRATADDFLTRRVGAPGPVLRIAVDVRFADAGRVAINVAEW